MGDFATVQHRRTRVPGQVDPQFSGFTPVSIEGCQIWLDANQITGLSDSDAVTTWEDKSGNGNDFTQGVTLEQPSYQTNIQNGLPAVFFDTATADGMIGTSSVAAPCTVFVVYSYESASSANRRAVQGANNWLIGPYSNTHQYYNGGFIAGPSVTQGVFVYARAEQTSTNGYFWVDGSSQGSNSGTTAPGVFHLGAEGAFSEPLDGYIGEVIVYNTQLSAANSASVESYLSGKWNI
jgi:hypothetical protein